MQTCMHVPLLFEALVSLPLLLLVLGLNACCVTLFPIFFQLLKLLVNTCTLHTQTSREQCYRYYFACNVSRNAF